MIRIVSLALSVCLAISMISSPANAQSIFTLAFDGPDTVTGPAGSVQSATYFMTIAHAGDDGPPNGAQGWSIIMRATNATVASNSISGTDAEALIDTRELFPGFPCNFQTYQMSADGVLACNAVILSFCDDRTLPTNATSTVAQLGVEFVIPECGGAASLEYSDEPDCFAGVADTNVVTENGQSFTLTNGGAVAVPKLIELATPDPGELILDLIDSVAALDSPPGVKIALAAALAAAKIILCDPFPINDGTAVAILEAFVVVVDSLPASKISPEDADALISQAQAILDLLASDC